MAIDYARCAHQKMIMVQKDLKKEYDHVNWSLLSCMIYNMGFGPCICRIIVLLGQMQHLL